MEANNEPKSGHGLAGRELDIERRYEDEKSATLAFNGAGNTGIHASPYEHYNSGNKYELEREACSLSSSQRKLSSYQRPASGSGSSAHPQLGDKDAAPKYPSGFALATVMVSLALAVLCVALDNTIIATAVPKITDEFHSLDDVGWYGSAFLLTVSAFQLFFGRLYSLLNVKWVFLGALFIFEVGSLICAVAQNSVTLIVGRAIAGLGSAGIFSGALIILASTTPLDKRGIYTGLITAVYGVASVVGPLLGGALTDHATWRWCFYINLPIGGVTLLGLLFFLHIRTPPKPAEKRTLLQKIARFDPIGTVLIIPCTVCLLLALQWGGTTYAWDNGRIIALFVLFGVSAIAFVVVQFWVGENATVPFRVASQRSIAFGSFFAICMGASYFTVQYYIPIWFQAIKGVSAEQSGIRTLPLMIAVILGNIVGGGGATACGYYTPFMYAGPVLGGIGAGLLYTWEVDTGEGRWIGYQVLYGLGLGLSQQLPLLAAQAVLPEADVATGTAVVLFAQMLSASVFLSVAQNLFTNHLASGLRRISNVNATAVVNSGATNITSLVQDPAKLHEVQVVYNDAIMQTFLVVLIAICISIFGVVGMEWKNIKEKKPETTEDGSVETGTSPPVVNAEE